MVKYFCDRKPYIRQLHKKCIVRKLMACLERSNVKLLVVVTSFLQNMAPFAEYKNKMADYNIVEVICKLVNRNIPKDLLRVTATLIYNLSFDTKMRHRMIKLDLLPKVVGMYGKSESSTSAADPVSRCWYIILCRMPKHTFRPTFHCDVQCE